jgi:hypothetical protein
MEEENAANWMFLRFWHDNDLLVWHASHITSYCDLYLPFFRHCGGTLFLILQLDCSPNGSCRAIRSVWVGPPPAEATFHADGFQYPSDPTRNGLLLEFVIFASACVIASTSSS